MSIKNWLDKACHVQTVYNSIDFSYRPSVCKKSLEKSKMVDNVSVAMGSSGDQDMFWMNKKQKRNFFIPVYFAFIPKRFKNEITSISS